MGCKNSKNSISDVSILHFNEDHSSCSWLCICLKTCTKPLRFNLNQPILNCVAMGEPSKLNMLIGDPSGIKLKVKFSEVHGDLEKRHKHTHLWLMALLILSLVVFIPLCFPSVIEKLLRFDNVKCHATTVCKTPNTTFGRDSECPSNSNWTVNCCTVYCHESRTSVYGLIPGCHPVTKYNDDIEQNKAFNAECNCIETPEVKAMDKKCGEVKLYGDFEEERDPILIRCVYSIAYGCVFLMVVANSLYKYYWYHQIKRALQNHFQDWHIYGIEVDYYRHNIHYPGALVFSLPSIQTVGLSLPHQPNNIDGNEDTSYGFLYNRY